MIDSNNNSFWTFPEFKTNSAQKVDFSSTENRKDIVFPDPKYYMIGFRVEKADKDADNMYNDWDTTHKVTNDTLKQTVNKQSSKNDTDEHIDT